MHRTSTENAPIMFDFGNALLKAAIALGTNKAKMLDDVTSRCVAVATHTPLPVVRHFHHLACSRNVFLARVGKGFLFMLMRDSRCEIVDLDGHQSSTSVCIAGQEWARVELRFSMEHAEIPPSLHLIFTELGKARLGKLARGA